MQFLKFLAMLLGLVVSASFFQPWPVAAFILGCAVGGLGCFEGLSAERKAYIEPVYRPKPTTVQKARFITLAVFGLAIIGELFLLWINSFLPVGREFLNSMALYFLGATVAAMPRSLANVRKWTEDHNKWLADMSPW